MNAIPDFNHAVFHELDPDVPDAARYDGWTGEKQKLFLTALSRGLNITRACAIVGLSRQSAYALRGAARGAAFALAWDAALLRARDVLADELMDRAFNGVRETVTYDDGRIVTRHRQDNQLAWKMLSRLDRRADAAGRDVGSAATRLAAADFEQLLDLVADDAPPARAGLFLAARIGAEGVGKGDDLAPIRTLARADRWLRTHADDAEAVDTADLDPARRADWSGDQWARAEDAGLVTLAPADPTETTQNCQLRQPQFEDEPVWWDDADTQWKTDFPPPEGFCGHESGEYGDADYWRTLTPQEEEAVEAPALAEMEAARPVAIATRDAWFAAQLAQAQALVGEQGREPVAASTP